MHQSTSHVFGTLSHCLFALTNICFSTKKSVYESLILAIFLYGAKHWLVLD